MPYGLLMLVDVVSMRQVFTITGCIYVANRSVVVLEVFMLTFVD